MTTQTPIHTFQDILDALETRPDLRQAMLRHLLTEQLLNLPAVVATMAEAMATMQRQLANLEGRVENLEAGQARLEAGQARLEAGQARLEVRAGNLETGQTRLESRVGNLTGEQYERRIARIFHIPLRQHAGIRDARVLHSPNHADGELYGLLSHAAETGLITSEQEEDLLNADVIAAGNGQDAKPRYALAEVSVTADHEDVERAERRAAILQQATQTPVTPIVICAQMPEINQARAAERGVTVIYRDE